MRDGLVDDKAAEIENPRKGLFFTEEEEEEEEEKATGEEELRNREDVEHCIAIFAENGLHFFLFGLCRALREVLAVSRDREVKIR